MIFQKGTAAPASSATGADGCARPALAREDLILDRDGLSRWRWKVPYANLLRLGIGWGLRCRRAKERLLVHSARRRPPA